MDVMNQEAREAASKHSRPFMSREDKAGGRERSLDDCSVAMVAAEGAMGSSPNHVYAFVCVFMDSFVILRLQVL